MERCISCGEYPEIRYVGKKYTQVVCKKCKIKSLLTRNIEDACALWDTQMINLRDSSRNMIKGASPMKPVETKEGMLFTDTFVSDAERILLYDSDMKYLCFIGHSKIERMAEKTNTTISRVIKDIYHRLKESTVDEILDYLNIDYAFISKNRQLMLEYLTPFYREAIRKKEIGGLETVNRIGEYYFTNVG